MRRAGDLIERIADPRNVRLAFIKACKGKRLTSDCRDFCRRLDPELDSLSRELRAGDVS